MPRALGSLLVLSLTLTACDFDLSDEPDPNDLPVLLPLAVGNTWAVDFERQWREEDGPRIVDNDTFRVVDSAVFEGETWYEVRSALAGQGFLSAYYTNRKDGVYRVDIRTPLAQLPDSVSVPDAAFLLYKFPAQAGDTYVIYEGLQVTVIDTRAPITLPFGTFEAYVYEFRPTQAWISTFPGTPSGVPLSEDAGVEYSAFIPNLGYADFEIAFMSTNGGTAEAPLWQTVFVNSWQLNAPPVLLDEGDVSAVRPSARTDAQRHGDLGAEPSLLVGGEAAPVPVGQRPVQRPE